MKLDAPSFVEEYFRLSVGIVKKSDKILEVLQQQIKENDLVNLKDSLYKLDFWVSHCLFDRLSQLNLSKDYAQALHLSILGTIRETFFGLALLFTHFEQRGGKLTAEKNEVLLMLYVRDILGIKIKKADQIFDAIYKVIEDLKSILELRIGLDDNKGFFDLIARNRQSFIEKKSMDQLLTSFSGEDLVWFRGLLKNISYYNKRFVIPR